MLIGRQESVSRGGKCLDPSNKDPSLSLPSCLGTGWHPELPALAVPIITGTASAAEGTPSPMLANRLEGFYSQGLLPDNRSRKNRAFHFLTGFRWPQRPAVSRFPNPHRAVLTTSVRLAVMGRAEN